MFVPKPATYVQIENISFITMSRVGGAVSASRTFDITMTLKNGMGEHQFSNINRYVDLFCHLKSYLLTSLQRGATVVGSVLQGQEHSIQE